MTEEKLLNAIAEAPKEIVPSLIAEGFAALLSEGTEGFESLKSVLFARFSRDERDELLAQLADIAEPANAD